MITRHYVVSGLAEIRAKDPQSTLDAFAEVKKNDPKIRSSHRICWCTSRGSIT